MIEKIAGALRHAGALSETIRDELKSFLAPEEDSREALALVLGNTAARHGVTWAAGATLADGLDTTPRNCFEYQTRVDGVAETLGWPIVDEALIRASAAFGLLVNDSATGCSYLGQVGDEEAARILE